MTTSKKRERRGTADSGIRQARDPRYGGQCNSLRDGLSIAVSRTAISARELPGVVL